MGLEKCRNMPLWVELTNGFCALTDFGRVVGIVAEEDVAVVLDFEVETAVNASEGSKKDFGSSGLFVRKWPMANLVL